MFIFGKNNNHLIKNNHKKTFSLPQKIKLFQKQIIKCVCGYDFMIFLAKKDLKVYCYYQSAIYEIQIKENKEVNNNTKTKVIDIATDDGLILFLSQKGYLYATDFDGQKIIRGQLNPKIVKLNISFPNIYNKALKSIFMSHSQIFIKFENNYIACLKRNHWIESKTFSDPELLNISKKSNIISIECNHQKINFYLTYDGNVYMSSKYNISNFEELRSKEKFIKIAANFNQLYGISKNGEILKITNFQNKDKLQYQNISKMTIKFIDLKVSQQNFYAITQNQQVWVWGKNSNGQLGLSDYQPRTSLYPMVSLQKYYIKNIYIGESYTCCQIDQNKIRQSASTSHRSNWLSSVRDVKRLGYNQVVKQKQNQNINMISSIQRVQPISYLETQQKQSQPQQSIKIQENVIINKKENYSSYLSNSTIKQKSKVSQNKSIDLKGKQKQTKLNKSVSNQSKCRSKYCTSVHPCKSGKKNNDSSSHIIDKSKSISKCKSNIKYHDSSLNQSSINQSSMSISKSLSRNQKISPHKYITPNKVEVAKVLQKKKSSKPKIQLVYETHRLQIQKLQQRNVQLQRQLRLKVQQNKDLYKLVKQKNSIIDDITSKISLLQQAIQQHQRTLTSRDNQAQQFYLKQKQYQLHIINLQNQIQKMIDIINKKQQKNNDKYHQSDIYRKQMQRLKLDIKQKMQGEKQYYRDRINSIENKFNQQKNLYELQIRNLQEQLEKYKNKQIQLAQRLTHRNQIYLPNNSSNLESPSFHTVDIKNTMKNKMIEQQLRKNTTLNRNILNNQSQYFSDNQQNQIYQEDKYILKEKNIYPTLNVKYQLQQKINKNIYPQNNQIIDENNQRQVNQIIERIQINKNFISKSANKLVNILEKDIY